MNDVLFVDVGVKMKYYCWNVVVFDKSYLSIIRICNVEIFVNFCDELKFKFKVGWINVFRGI